MVKHRATLEQIRRLNGGLHWSKVEKLLRSYGAEVHESGGSTVTFVLADTKLTVDRPHPRKECGKGLVKRVREYLRKVGEL
jgi:predicted RNA binding protein YcfA (HicA-like mRNA interferase family)